MEDQKWKWLWVFLFFSITVSGRAQYSAYLPEEGQWIVTPVYAFHTYDKFWVGEDGVSLSEAAGLGDYEQHTGFISLEYGLTRSIALDLTGGYLARHFTDGGPDDEGWMDTSAGVRWQLIDEYTFGDLVPLLPTVTWRVGGTIEGTYDEDFPFGLGEGASGVETALLFGKVIGAGFGLYGDVGYRLRGDGVPDEVFGSIGVYKSLWDRFTVSVGLKHAASQWGKNVGDPGFAFARTEKRTESVEAGFGYADPGGRFYQIFVSKTLEGRNTGEKEMIGFLASFPF